MKAKIKWKIRRNAKHHLILKEILKYHFANLLPFFFLVETNLIKK